MLSDFPALDLSDDACSVIYCSFKTIAGVFLGFFFFLLAFIAYHNGVTQKTTEDQSLHISLMCQ